MDMTQETARGDDVTIRIPEDAVDDVRLMLREQIAGDSEELRWLRENPGEGKRRGDHHLGIDRLRARLETCWRLGDALGGLYGVGAIVALVVVSGA